ncbi:hypothetical protein ACM66B_002632 [Microbotryomycetes sp. NB124-2]
MTRAWTDSISPIDESWPVQDQIAALQQLKNGLVGHVQRKVAFLQRADVVASIVKVLGSPPADAHHNDVCALSIQAASVLGAASMPQAQAVTSLLQARAHITVAQCLATVLGPVPSSATFPSRLVFVKQLTSTSKIKLSEALLRTLKVLCSDYVNRPKERSGIWDSTSDPTASVSTSTTLRDDAIGHGTDIDVDGDKRSQDQKQMDEVNTLLLGWGSKQPEIMDLAYHQVPLLVTLLYECAGVMATAGLPDTTILFFCDSPTTKTRFADMACGLLVSVLKTINIDMAGLHVIVWAPDLLRAISTLIRTGSGKMRDSALGALTALARGKSKFGILLAKREKGSELTDLQYITELCEASSPSLRLHAIICRTVIHKSLKDFPSLLSSWELAQPMVPALLNLIETEQSLRSLAMTTLTHLIADNEELQKQAVKLKTLDILRAVIEESTASSQPYETTASRSQATQTQEAAFMCIACLCYRSEAYRHAVLAAKLLSPIVQALSHPAAPVRAAACHCIRGLGRSVNVLRTSLVDTGAAGPLCHLLREEEDLLVQTTAAAAVSNLVLEFSPLRQILIDRGCIPKLCRLAHKEDIALRLNALWSLKNASYQSTSAFKRSLAAELGWWFLADLIVTRGTPAAIVEQALGILRNLTCTFGDDAVTGLDDAEMGEDKMLGLVEHALQSDSQEIVLQALYTVVNLATASESTKLAIAARTDLLRSIKLHLSSSRAETRSASVWCVINLCYVERSSFRRRPREILDKLKALGVDDELRRMSADETSLDVRERVRDAMEVFVGGTGTQEWV